MLIISCRKDVSNIWKAYLVLIFEEKQKLAIKGLPVFVKFIFDEKYIMVLATHYSLRSRLL